jgi:DNA-binding transcriptional LysR family regulator
MKTELHPAKQVPPLRLWAHPALAAAQLGKFLRVLQPVQQRESIQVIEDADTADVWLTAQSCAPADAPFTPLWQERYSLVLPMGHPLSRLPSLDMTVLHNEPFVERRHCELAASWHLHLAERGIRPQVVASAPSEEWALELVAAGIGVTIAPIPPGPRRADLVFHDHITELQSVPRVMGATLRTPRAQQHLSAALSAITPLQLQAAA